MRSIGSRLFSVLLLGALAFAPGCVSGEELNELLLAAAKDTAIAIGNLVVENAVESVF